MLILNTMCKLMFAAGVGYYLNKRGILDAKINAGISSLIIQVTSPCLIISSVTSVDSSDKSLAIQLLLIAIVVYCVLPVLAFVLSRIFRFPKDVRKTYECMLIFANTGFIALPILQSIFGSEAAFYNSLLNMPFNFLFFSLGAYMLAQDGEEKFNFRPQQLLSVGIISSVLAIIIYFGDITLPTFISESLSFVGNITTPLSMISIGCSVATYSIKEILSNKDLYLIALLRLAVIPLITYFSLSALIDNTMIIQMVTICFGMPVGSMVAMGACEYNGNIKAASSGVALTTILCVITIPIMLMLLGVS